MEITNYSIKIIKRDKDESLVFFFYLAIFLMEHYSPASQKICPIAQKAPPTPSVYIFITYHSWFAYARFIST